MRRRSALVALFALGASALPIPNLAQIPRLGRPARIGFFLALTEIAQGWFVAAMKQHGWREGRDFEIVHLGSPADPANLDPAAARLIADKPDLIFTQGTSRALALHRRTPTIPIVMWTSGYPVEVGLANSLARPGKNVTGNTIYAGAAVWGKMVELLNETVPAAKRIGVLWGYAPPGFLREEIDPPQQEIRQAARVHGLSVHVVEYAGPDRVPEALMRLEDVMPEALIVAGRGPLGAHHQRAMQFAEQRRLATIVDSLWPQTEERNPLLAYGVSWEVLMRQAVSYVDRILRGADPGHLPIQRPSKIELIVNLGTARALGLTIPQSILLRADRVIE